MAWSRVLGGSRVLMSAAKKSSSSRVSSPAAAKKKRVSSPAEVSAEMKEEKPTSGFMKPLPVSPAMKDFVGSPEISRGLVIKKIWEHIKLHNLQNPTNKKEILCDEQLKTILQGKDKVGMLDISRLVAPHFLKSD
ncbi:upstream activation factor subunit spp27 [Iris pallida]|uniref:Upstream activation factor subunit spp27 n=1 Tax=Iris pallida TaxID=29817 RepID=A0AAX6H0U8_IRIPA|nr:upstream activation factor subunit spp27 [Iris pallida]